MSALDGVDPVRVGLHDPTAPADDGSALTVPPVFMTSEEIEHVQAQTNDLVRAVRESAGGRQLAVLDEVTSLGLESQRNAGRQLELVKIRLGSFLHDGGAGRAVATDLVELRGTLDRLNPHLEHRGLWQRTVGALPFGRNNMMVRVLKKIALRYEPVSKQVTMIEVKLREGRTLLARDNMELRRLYEDVEAQDEAVARQIYVGQLLLDALAQLAGQPSDPIQHDRLQAAVHDVAIRIQDLRAMQEVHAQYFVSIELTRQNNNRLGQAVDRTLTLATNAVTIGLAIQAALIRQRSVREATERTRGFLGEVVTQNAAAIREQTEQIGDLYNEPVIAMDKLAQAHRDLLTALDSASKLREEGVLAARANIATLATLTDELSTRVAGLEDEAARP